MPKFDINLQRHTKNLELLNLYVESGRVKNVRGPIVEGTMIDAPIGGVCYIERKNSTPIEAEIIGFQDRTAILMPLEYTDSISMGAQISMGPAQVTLDVGDMMCGCLLNGQGKLIKSFSSEVTDEAEWNKLATEHRSIKAAALSPVSRGSIHERLVTGVRSIDSTIPIGLGQRMALMAASGVGKSMLMGMMAKDSKADINVIALIGERGREVSEFVEGILGPEGMKRSIVVAVTSDESPVLKVRGAYVASTIAEYFRDQGKNVVLMMDSVTRFAMALREIGLSSGEPPTTKGYTPSVFSHMPKLLERAGPKKGSGSITGIYTVLVEGNDFDDPIADSVRSIVDGHIVLNRNLAHQGHYPAVDILASVSRLSTVLLSDREATLNQSARENLSIYKEAEDLINIGGYRKGTNEKWDKAINVYPKIVEFLRQGVRERSELSDTLARLEGVFRG